MFKERQSLAKAAFLKEAVNDEIRNVEGISEIDKSDKITPFNGTSNETLSNTLPISIPNTIAQYTNTVFQNEIESDGVSVQHEEYVRESFHIEPGEISIQDPEFISDEVRMNLTESFALGFNDISWLNEDDEIRIHQDQVLDSGQQSDPIDFDRGQVLSDITDTVITKESENSLSNSIYQTAELFDKLFNDKFLSRSSSKRFLTKLKWLSADKKDIEETKNQSFIDLLKGKIRSNFKSGDNKENEFNFNSRISSISSKGWKNWKPYQTQFDDEPVIRKLVKSPFPDSDNNSSKRAKFKEFTEMHRSLSAKSIENFKNKIESFKIEQRQKHFERKAQREAKYKPLNPSSSQEPNEKENFNNLKIVDNKIKKRKSLKSLDNASLDQLCEMGEISKMEVLKRLQDGSIKTRNINQ